MDVKLTQWKKHGDHPLVEENTCREFPYEDLANEGCGFINTFTTVYPGNYIVEINGIFIGVVSEIKGRAIFINEPKTKKPVLIRRTGKSKSK